MQRLQFYPEEQSFFFFEYRSVDLFDPLTRVICVFSSEFYIATNNSQKSLYVLERLIITN